MERSEVIRRMVLNEISDDYENVDQVILPNVARECANLGIIVERSQVVEALAELVESGLAKAYRLSCIEPAEELRDMPPVDVVEEHFKTYFYISEKGLEVHLSDDASPPFDEDGNSRR
ncbi:MAG TPA: hypothetical protein VG675_14120 [Bryobacteraceae bacterium]|nr:hypothetical protein [Bryobacteraceae bacterium]